MKMEGIGDGYVELVWRTWRVQVPMGDPMLIFADRCCWCSSGSAAPLSKIMADNSTVPLQCWAAVRVGVGCTSRAAADLQRLSGVAGMALSLGPESEMVVLQS